MVDFGHLMDGKGFRTTVHRMASAGVVHHSHSQPTLAEGEARSGRDSNVWEGSDGRAPSISGDYSSGIGGSGRNPLWMPMEYNLQKQWSWVDWAKFIFYR